MDDGKVFSHELSNWHFGDDCPVILNESNGIPLSLTVTVTLSWLGTKLTAILMPLNLYVIVAPRSVVVLVPFVHNPLLTDHSMDGSYWILESEGSIVICSPSPSPALPLAGLGVGVTAADERDAA